VSLPLRHTGEGYEYVVKECDSTDTPVYIHRLCVVAWDGLEALEGCDVHHETPIPWLNTEENLSPEPAFQHRRGELARARMRKATREERAAAGGDG